MTSKDLVLVYIAYYIKNAIYLELNINVKSWPKKNNFPQLYHWICPAAHFD